MRILHFHNQIFFIIIKYLAVFFTFLIIALIVYSPLLHAEFIRDDNGQIVGNLLIRSLKDIPLLFKGGTFYSSSFHGLLDGYYRPMMTATYAVIYALFGLHANFFHLSQIILHVIATFFLYLVYEELFKKLSRKSDGSFIHSNFIPFIISLIFLIHPMNSEAVSYLANLQDVLQFLFGITALLLLIKTNNPFTTFLFVPLLLTLSLLSKESGVIFISIILSYVYIWHQKKLKVLTIIYSLPIVGYIFLRFFIAHQIYFGGANTPISKLGFLAFLKQIPTIISFYLTTFIFPLHLSSSYHWVVREVNWISFYLPFLFCILFFTFFIGFWYLLNEKIDKKTQQQKVFMFFSSWFLVALLFHLHIIPLDAAVAERWFYTAMAGLLGLIGTVIQLYWQKKYNRLGIFLLLTLFIFFGYISHERAYQWQNSFRLYSHDVSIAPDTYDLENNLGTEYLAKGQRQIAKKYFIASTSSNPDWPSGWDSLGAMAEEESNYREAEYNYRQAMKGIGKFHYVTNELFINLLIKEHKYKEAKKILDNALKFLPRDQTLQKMYQEVQKHLIHP